MSIVFGISLDFGISLIINQVGALSHLKNSTHIDLYLSLFQSVLSEFTIRSPFVKLQTLLLIAFTFSFLSLTANHSNNSETFSLARFSFLSTVFLSKELSLIILSLGRPLTISSSISSENLFNYRIVFIFLPEVIGPKS